MLAIVLYGVGSLITAQGILEDMQDKRDLLSPGVLLMFVFVSVFWMLFLFAVFVGKQIKGQTNGK